MSEKLYRKVGEKLNLTMQLHDGVSTFPKRVFINVFNSSGTKTVNFLELPHIEGGLFIENTLTMPATSRVLNVQYIVTDADGVTESEEHTRSYDKVEREIAADVDFPSSITPKPFALVAKVRNKRPVINIRSTQRIKIGVRDE